MAKKAVEPSVLTIEALPKMTVAMLKNALEERELPIIGKKQELIDRMTEALQSENSTIQSPAKSFSASPTRTASPIKENPGRDGKVSSPSKVGSLKKGDEAVAPVSPVKPKSSAEAVSPKKSKPAEKVSSPDQLAPAKTAGDKAASPVKKAPKSPQQISPVKASSPTKQIAPPESPGKRMLLDEPRSPAKKVKLDHSGSPFCTVYIEKFTRPLNLETLKSKLSEKATLENFWMDRIRSHCYATFSKSENAKAVCDLMNGLELQPGNILQAKLVRNSEAEADIEAKDNISATTASLMVPPELPSLRNDLIRDGSDIQGNNRYRNDDRKNDRDRPDNRRTDRYSGDRAADEIKLGPIRNTDASPSITYQQRA